MGPGTYFLHSPWVEVAICGGQVRQSHAYLAGATLSRFYFSYTIKQCILGDVRRSRVAVTINDISVRRPQKQRSVAPFRRPSEGSGGRARRFLKANYANSEPVLTRDGLPGQRALWLVRDAGVVHQVIEELQTRRP
jgi:hypothetical protein